MTVMNGWVMDRGQRGEMRWQGDGKVERWKGWGGGMDGWIVDTAFSLVERV